MRSISSDLLLQRVGEASGSPLNKRLYECIRTAILDGSLAPGARMPATRDLAGELGVSRNTVLFAYEQLLAEGYMRSRTGSGTFIADTSPESYLIAGRSAAGRSTELSVARLSRRGTRVVERAFASPVQWGPFVPGVPDVTQFPHRRFRQITTRLWRNPPPELLTYAHGGGHLGLREALAEHLRVARSMRCDPAQLLITEGIHQAIDLVVRLLGDPGDLAWVEEPGYWGIRSVLQINDVAIKPVAVDEEGMQLPKTGSRKPPRFIFVTPSHQYPLGSVMSLARRRQLLEFARANGSWIVEDDYDSEFRFSGRPIPALQGLEPDAPVIYIGTFSKSMYPGLRIGYLVLPRALVAPFQKAHAELYREGHLLPQAALGEFIRQGYYASHIRRMRLLYGKRRAILVSLIEQRLGPEYLHGHGSNAGLHVVLRLPDHVDDCAVAEAAKARGVLVRPLSRYYMGGQARRGLLLGYACVPDAQIQPAFDSLLKCIPIA